MPRLSPMSCTSTCRARRTSFSRKTSSLPNAAIDSRRAAATCSARSPARSITRMPRPPPPQLALAITGKPTLSAARCIAASSWGRGPVAGHHRKTGYLSETARLELAAQNPHHVRLRSDEEETGGDARLGKVGVLGEEAVARVNRVDPRFARDAHDIPDVEIGVDRLPAPADRIGFVRLEAVQGVAVFVREDRDRPDAQLVRRAQHPYRDFAAVGDQQFSDASSAFHDLCRTSCHCASPAVRLGLAPRVPVIRGRSRPGCGLRQSS